MHIWITGKKRSDSKQSSVLFFSTFDAKVKTIVLTHTQRFCKYVQKQKEETHRLVKGALGEAVFIHEAGLRFGQSGP